MSYFGRIANITYMEPPTPIGQPRKFPVLRVDVTHEPLPDSHKAVSVQILPLAPNAIAGVKRWFSMFGMGEIPNFDIDDATDVLIDPDLTGTPVMFSVEPNGAASIEGVAHPSKCESCGSWSQA
jgi:hypothetical protein